MLLGHWMEMRAVGGAQSASTSWRNCCPRRRSASHGDPRRSRSASCRTATWSWFARARRCPPTASSRRGEPGRREHDHRRVAAGEKPPGDAVIAGTINGDGTLRVAGHADGDDTALAGIMRLVAEAQNSRARPGAGRPRRLLATFSSRSAPARSRSSSGSLVARPRRLRARAGRHRARHRLPARARAGHPAGDRDLHDALGARNGILVARPAGARARRATSTSCVFDKTGTLTQGEQPRGRLSRPRRVEDDELLAWSRQSRRDSEHPLARAIVARRGSAGSACRRHRFEALPGHGVQATVDGPASRSAGRRCCERPARLPAALAERLAPGSRAGPTVLYVLDESAVVGGVRAGRRDPPGAPRGGRRAARAGRATW